LAGRVLIIAGSDSGGGAGVQADLKTVTALGAYGATAITAITVQDTQKVHAVHPVPPKIIRSQIEVVLHDIGADAIKIGMIGDRAAGKAILAGLEGHPDIPLVLDPVLVATSGDSLGDEGVRALLVERFVPKAAVVTPNLPELAALTGIEPGTDEAIAEAARQLISRGAGAVLVKGGHGKGDTVSDRLFTENGVTGFDNPRLETRNTHGTGCTLASAIAAGLSGGVELREATERAIAYVREAIRTAPGLGQGHGPLNHTHTFRP
jgi:hydroxymethylpyrimidine/phosphomethylpyrimidine kinase